MRNALRLRAISLPFVIADALVAQRSQMQAMRESGMRTDDTIQIVIDPEARVNVVAGHSLPPPAKCEQPSKWRVTIVNHGFVTTRLEAELIGNVPPGVVHDWPLNAVPKAFRALRVTLTKAWPTDLNLTLAFKLRNEVPELSGCDRVSCLMHCLAAADARGTGL
jgi:hypothetical protein